MSINRSSSKTLVDIGRALLSSANEENREATTALPRINTKKQMPTTQDNHNFVNKNTHRDSVSDLVKESLAAFAHQGKSMNEELSRKLDEQKRELDVRNQNVFAIQRNYDGLSAMLKKEKDLGAENKRKVSALADDNSKLVDENKHLLRRIDDMIERLKKYEHEAEIGLKEKNRASQTTEEINLLKGRLQEIQFQFEKKKKEAADVESRNKFLLGQVDKYKNSASNLEEEKQKGLLQLKETRNDLLITQTENDRLHKIIVEYKIKLSDLEKMRGEYDSIASYKLDMEKENRDLRKEISTLRNEVANLKNLTKKLEDGNQSQSVQMKLVSDKEEGYKKEIDQLNNSLNSANDEISKYVVKIEQLQKSLNEENLRFFKYNSVITIYDQIIGDGGEPMVIRKADYDRLKVDVARYKEKADQLEEIKKKFEKLNTDLERKDAQIDQYVADKQFDSDRYKKLSERVKVLEEENKRYATHSQKLQNALDYKNQNEKAKEGHFNEEIESLRKRLDSNISNLGDINFKQKSAAAEKDHLTKQIDMFKKEIDTKMKEIEILKKKLAESDSLQNEREIAQLKAQLNKLYDLQKSSYHQIEDLKANVTKKDEKITELTNAYNATEFKARLTQLEEREGNVNKAIAKIDHCQSSLIVSMACSECLGSMKNPVTLIPCGHNYCEKCLPQTPHCKDCGEKKGKYQTTFRNRLLEEVVAKVNYNQVILENMKPKTTPAK